MFSLYILYSFLFIFVTVSANNCTVIYNGNSTSEQSIATMSCDHYDSFQNHVSYNITIDNKNVSISGVSDYEDGKFVSSSRSTSLSLINGNCFSDVYVGRYINVTANSTILGVSTYLVDLDPFLVCLKTPFVNNNSSKNVNKATMTGTNLTPLTPGSASEYEITTTQNSHTIAYDSYNTLTYSPTTLEFVEMNAYSASDAIAVNLSADSEFHQGYLNYNGGGNILNSGVNRYMFAYNTITVNFINMNNAGSASYQYIVNRYSYTNSNKAVSTSDGYCQYRDYKNNGNSYCCIDNYGGTETILYAGQYNGFSFYYCQYTLYVSKAVATTSAAPSVTTKVSSSAYALNKNTYVLMVTLMLAVFMM